MPTPPPIDPRRGCRNARRTRWERPFFLRPAMILSGLWGCSTSWRRWRGARTGRRRTPTMLQQYANRLLPKCLQSCKGFTRAASQSHDRTEGCRYRVCFEAAIARSTHPANSSASLEFASSAAVSPPMKSEIPAKPRLPTIAIVVCRLVGHSHIDDDTQIFPEPNRAEPGHQVQFLFLLL